MDSDRPVMGARLELARAYAASGNRREARRVLEELAPWCEEALGAEDELTRSVLVALASQPPAVDVIAGQTAEVPGGTAPSGRVGTGPPLTTWYEGPYVAATGSWPRPFVFVADGTLPDEVRFGPPRAAGERDGVPDTSALRAESCRPDSVGLRVADAELEVNAAHRTARSPRPVRDEVAGEESAPSSPQGRRRVVVRVLGPVEVTGWFALPGRTIVTEIVCYLALHDRPIHAEELRLALRPEGTRPIGAETFRSHLSYVRRALGEELFPQAGPDGYRLGEGVVTDWALFRELAARATVDGLTGALRLVRGRPFTGATGDPYLWARSEGIAQGIETEVAEVAESLTGLARRDGNDELTAWAARRARFR